MADYLTPSQVAKMSGVDYQRVLRDIQKGNLIAFKLGPAYAITRMHAIEYAENGGEACTAENIARLEKQLNLLKRRYAEKQEQRRQA